MDQNKIDALRAHLVPTRGHVIGGKFVPASDGGLMDILSPLDGQALTQVARGTTAGMERAIASARAAFNDGRWTGQPPAARKKVLLEWADLIEANTLELALLGVRDNGTEFSTAIKAEPGLAAGTIRYYAEALDKIYSEIASTPSDILGMIHKKLVGVVGVVGVVGAIIPWNFPMMIGAWKLGPALAMGNSVVLKPGETASLSLMRMVELTQNLGFVDTARAEGGDVVLGRERILQETGGYFMEPTIVTCVTPDATLSQKKVFGPVLGVTASETDDDAVRIANATVYGLAGAVWRSNLSRAHKMVRAVRTGVMHVNTYGGADGTVPLGGVGQSGNGSEKSLHAIEKYVNLKTAWIKL